MNSQLLRSDSPVYSRAPIKVVNAIPVFCDASRYIDNYETIAADHLKAESAHGTNPFIPQQLWAEMEQTTIELIARYAEAGDRILDVGVGLGRLLRQVPQLDRYGTDISLTYLAQAAQHGIDVCCAMVEDLPYHTGMFDVVTCTDVLEHVLDLNLACHSMLRVLEPGGVLIVRVPYREDLAVYTSPSCPYEFVHLRNFDEHSLRLLFEKIIGAEVLEMRMHGSVARPSRLGSALPPPAGNTAWSNVLRTGRRVAASAYRRVARWRAQPFEISVVVRKP
jgi:2-polyprenyl-3-methyl-5-hydroxy-6-metoxy-1,4-benzoquinol methylase